MRGCGESFKPMLLVCIGICVLRVAWVTFISPHYPTLKGVVISYPITWFTTSFLFIIYYKHFKRSFWSIVMRRTEREITDLNKRNH